MRASLTYDALSTLLCLGCVATAGLLCGCTDHITVGRHNLIDLNATETPDGGGLAMGCNEITQLKPVVNLGAIASEVVPGANPCEIAVDSAGLMVAACASSIPATVGVDALAPGQNQELFVQKRAANGTLIFHTPIAGIAPLAVEVAESGDTFVLGSAYSATDGTSGFSLVRLTPTGDIAWKNEYYKLNDGAGAYGALAVAVDGTLWVTGSANFVAARYDASANELQRLAINVGDTPGWGQGQTIVTLDNGDILVAGVFNQPLDLGGGLLGDDAGNQSSGFLARYSSSGQYVTSQVFAADGVRNVGLANGTGGSVVLTGNLTSATPSAFGCSMPDSTSKPGFIAKLDDSLSVEWARLIPAVVGAPAVDAQGHINLPIKGPDGVYLATIDPTGTTGTTRVTASGAAASYHVAVSPTGTTYVSGAFVGSVSFSSAPLKSDGQAAYLLSIAP